MLAMFSFQNTKMFCVYQPFKPWRVPVTDLNIKKNQHKSKKVTRTPYTTASYLHTIYTTFTFTSLPEPITGISFMTARLQ